MNKLIFVSLLASSVAAAQPEPDPTPTPPPTPTPTPTPPTLAPAPIIVPDEPVPATPTPPTRPVPSGQPQPGPTTLDELVITTSRARLEINLFGGIRAIGSADPHYLDFSLAPLGFLVSGRMSDTLSTLAEFVMETTEDGEAVVDLERVVLRWSHGPITVGAGRTHTELGYWNTAFHHGTWLQLPIERPFTLRFEDDGGLLPIHAIGGFGEYRAPVGRGKVRLHLAVGNGRGANVDDIRVASDLNAAKSILLNVSLDDVIVPGSHVGAAVLYDRIAPEDAMTRPLLPDTAINEVIGNVFGVLRGSKWTAIGEGYWIAHLANGERYSTFEGFGLVGYTVDRWTPYVLGEARTRTGDTPDPYFVLDPGAGPIPKLFALDVGLRVELSTWSAAKLEAGVVRVGGETVKTLTVDWAFGL